MKVSGAVAMADDPEHAFGITPAMSREITALLALAEHGIPPDVQELLVYGDPSRGIAPGALRKALNAP